MKKYFKIVFIFLLSISIKAQSNCDNDTRNYSIKEKISKKEYKKRNIKNRDNLKRDLVKQITSSISVISVLNETNITNGETGSYLSNRITESYSSSMGEVINPTIIYCKENKSYFAVCRVDKKAFDKSFYNSIFTKNELLNDYLNNRNKGLNILLKKNDYYFIKNGISFVQSSEFISEDDKEKLFENVKLTIALFDKKESENILNFDNQIENLYTLLNNEQFETIKKIITSVSYDKLDIKSKNKYFSFEQKFEQKLKKNIKNLEDKIEKAIRTKDKKNEIESLLIKYKLVTFNEQTEKKYNYFLKKISVKNGYSRTNLSFGIYAGSTFKSLSKEDNVIGVDSIKKNINLNQILPSFSLGFKQYFFNPEKRVGLSLNYSSYLKDFIELKKTDTPLNNINDFTTIQIGLLLGPLELKYGKVFSDNLSNDLALLGMKLTLIRTDRLTDNKFGKINNLGISIFSDYLSDFKDSNSLQFGIGLNYDICLKRTGKY